MRATLSVGPPGAKPTSSRIGLDGQLSWANAWPPVARTATPHSSVARRIPIGFFMSLSL